MFSIFVYNNVDCHLNFGNFDDCVLRVRRRLENIMCIYCLRRENNETINRRSFETVVYEGRRTPSQIHFAKILDVMFIIYYSVRFYAVNNSTDSNGVHASAFADFWPSYMFYSNNRQLFAPIILFYRTIVFLLNIYIFALFRPVEQPYQSSPAIPIFNSRCLVYSVCCPLSLGLAIGRFLFGLFVNIRQHFDLAQVLLHMSFLEIFFHGKWGESTCIQIKRKKNYSLSNVHIAFFLHKRVVNIFWTFLNNACTVLEFPDNT